MVKCKECGCTCLAKDHDVHLHVEIEHLKQKLLERENHIVTMETTFLNEANKFPNGELVAIQEELLTWQDKYKRLYEAHRRVQRVNQGLEDKLLKLVDTCETDKNILTKDVATLSQKLAEANYAIKKLSEDNERYKNDVSLAIQFLQCKQSNFVAHKFDSLPDEVQVQVSAYMTNKRKPEEKKVTYEMKSIKVPIPTFPPTAMVYSIPKSPKPERKHEEEPESPQVDIVSAAIMAKVLEERQKEKAYAKHCDTCTCSKKLSIVYEITHHTAGTQTESIRLQAKPDAAKKVQNENDTTGNNVVKVQPNNFLIDETNTTVDLNFFSTNEVSQVRNNAKASRSEASAKYGSSGNFNGLRYCSMKGRDLLLGNNDIVLYKRREMLRETPTTHSGSSGEVKQSLSETSVQNRVAEWVQNNVEQEEVSSSDNSRSEPIVKMSNMERVKYAEMEEHVKRFLFGESEFLKTVEIGKLKYQNFRENEGGSMKSKTPAETEI